MIRILLLSLETLKKVVKVMFCRFLFVTRVTHDTQCALVYSWQPEFIVFENLQKTEISKQDER